MIALLASVAFGQQPAEVRTTTDLQDCLDAPVCEGLFTTLLSESMVEMGFLFQHDAMGGSALAGKGNGFVVELNVHSAALGPRNVVMENLQLPPAVPVLEVGYQVGSFTYDDPYPQYAVSAFLFPPIRLDDYRAFTTGASASLAIPLATHFVWAGAEADVSYGSVVGPFVGDGGVIEDIDVVGDLIDVQQPPCDTTSDGCIDRFRTLAVLPKLGLSFEPAPPMFFYLKGGAAWVTSDIRVAYDDSRWVLKGLQPQVSYGGGVRLGDRVQITAGGVTALKPEALSSDDSRTLTRVVASFSVHTGDARYWSKDVEPPPDPEPAAEPEPVTATEAEAEAGGEAAP